LSGAASASPWFVRHAPLVREAARLGPVVDFACGGGRHTLAAAALGAYTLGIDRDSAALKALLGEAQTRALPFLVTGVRADLETRHHLPLRPDSCGAILVLLPPSTPGSGPFRASFGPAACCSTKPSWTIRGILGTAPPIQRFFSPRVSCESSFPDLRFWPTKRGSGRGNGLRCWPAWRPAEARRASGEPVSIVCQLVEGGRAPNGHVPQEGGRSPTRAARAGGAVSGRRSCPPRRARCAGGSGAWRGATRYGG
jgi:SAM-dependent methyltransferase